MWVSLTAISANTKTGPIPVSVTEEKSCPTTCPLHNTDCYARFGPLAIHWKKTSKKERGGNWGAFCGRVKKFPKGQLWRHNSAGDLPGSHNRLNKTLCIKLARANQGKCGFTYTHYRPTSHNLPLLQEMNRLGFTVNLSADDLTMADNYAKMGLPTVVTIPSDSQVGLRTPEGRTVVICPAQTQDDMNCAACQLCQVRDRKSIVGFLAHGTASKRLDRRLSDG